ncbi:hypothetical protein WDU94_001364 [Cyamophila willieti]
MYSKVVALVVIMAAVALADPIPQPRADANPGYTNSYGRYVPTNEDFANPASPYYNPYAVGPNHVNPYNPAADPYVNPAANPAAYPAYYPTHAMYSKVVALVVVMAAVALADPIPQPRADANPGYTNSYGRYVPTNEDFANPASAYYNPYAVGPNHVNPYNPAADPYVNPAANPAAYPYGNPAAYPYGNPAAAYYPGKYVY